MEAEMRSFRWPFMIRERRSYDTLLAAAAAAAEASVINIDTHMTVHRRLLPLLGDGIL